MAAAGAVMYGVYNVSQLTAAKEKTVNGADAAALAGAQVEARVLNLVAYNNRSLIANEVFLAQMLSMESWLGYVQHTAQNFGTVADVVGIFVWPVEYLGQVLGEISTLVDEGRTVLGEANTVLIDGLEVAKKVLLGAHTVVIKGGALLAENAAYSVIGANRAQFNTHQDAGLQIDNSPAVRALTFYKNETRWNDFTKLYQDNDRSYAAQVLTDSLDKFSANRPGQWWFNFKVPYVFQTKKSGGSRLKNYDRWETQDTFELDTDWNFVKGRWDVKVPIGWGRANADDNGGSGDLWASDTVNEEAYSDGSGHSHSNWSGVPTVYDIKDRSAKASDLVIDFLVAARRPQANTLTTSQLGMGIAVASPTGSSEMDEQLAGNKISAFAKARVSFERPQRGLANDKTATPLWRPDGAKEIGSLYSPYWQARLVDLTQNEKMALMGASGIDPLLVKFTPGGQN